jgi:sodium-independent sulfate anion transporter 11
MTWKTYEKNITNIHAQPLVITGSVITIVADQASTMLGIPDIRTGDPAYKVTISTFKNLGKTRLDAAMGVTALVILYLIRFACDKASQRYSSKKRFYFFLSTLRTVFVILFFTLISWLVNRKHRTAPKFAILGHIPRGT